MNRPLSAATSEAFNPQRLKDIEAIRRLTHDYSRAVDQADLDELIALFTEDAEWDTTAFGMGVVTGHAALREFFTALITNTQSRCHMALNHRIEVAGDTASATVYLHAFVTMQENARCDESVGYYNDEYVRTLAGWKFQRRVANPLMAPPAAPLNDY